MALVKCEECGKEISSDTAACPQCGKPRFTASAPPPSKKMGCLGMVGLIIVGTIIVSYIGTHFGSDSGPASAAPGAIASSSQKSSAPDYITTARDLYRDYEANEVATDQKIGGAPVKISGTIASIDKDFKDSAVINLATGNEFAAAGLELADFQKSLAATLSKGQRITIHCEKMARVLNSPRGSDCVVVE